MSPQDKPVFALVDCNNFYASCEKLFRPDLKHTPVVVLSNNDGCIVARSREAKALGFKMGSPFFQVQADLCRMGVQVFSSNYALYADISNRVMTTLEQLAPEVEVYSIDEAFLNLTGVPGLEQYGQQVRKQVYDWTGIATCIGIAPTKTLAKLANHAAKQYPATGGVVDLTDRQRQIRLMKLVPVGDVWGVGRRISAKLNAMGVRTAWELAVSNPKSIRRQFSVVLERTVAELNAESCLELEQVTPARQQIVCGRSFGSKISQLASMQGAVSNYTARAGEKPRADNLRAGQLSVSIRTSGFESAEPQYSNNATGRLMVATSDTRALVGLAMQLLQSIWRDGYRFAKAEVMLFDFQPAGMMQGDLFTNPVPNVRQEALMKVVDAINASGKGRIFLASQGIHEASWGMKREFLSPAYTTRWSDLPVVR